MVWANAGGIVHFASWYRNEMVVEIAEELREAFDVEKTGLGVAAEWVGEERVLREYLDRGFGNGYDFDQTGKVEGVF